MLLVFMICLTIFMSTITKKKGDAWLTSAVIWTVVCYALTEFLSIGNNLDFIHLLAAYIVLTVFVLILIFYQVKKKQIRLQWNLQWFTGKSKKERAVIGLLGLFMVFIVIMSIVCIPYDVDSLTYHLTRIAYWTQNKSVAHFATNDVRAVTSPPLAEFVNLHVYILHQKSDLFCNLLQAASYVTNAYLVWGIAGKLKLKSQYGYLSVLLYISTPIAFAEAFTTQVDQFAALWMVLFVYFILDFLQDDFCFSFCAEVVGKVLILGACIAFAYLSKPTGLFAVVIFAVWLLIVCIKRKDKVSVLIGLIGIAAVEMLLIVIPEIGRNLITFHALSSSSVGAKHMVDTLNPVYLFLNFAKNVSVNLPNIYIPWFAEIVKYIICWVAFKFNIDINDTAIAHDGAEYILRSPQHYVQDSAVNPIILYFTGLVILWLIKKWICKEKRDMLDHFSYAAIVSFLFFCLVLKYELYSVRYMIGYFAVLCPVIAGQLARMKWKQYEWKKFLVPVVVFMCCVELLALFEYHAHIWLRHLTASDRIEGYFEFREKDEKAYRQLGEYLEDKEYDDLGVYLTWRSGEYPIWKLVDEESRIEAVNVNNETAMYMDEEFVPDYIIVKDAEPKDIEDYLGKDYRLEEVFDEKIYLYKLY